MMTSAKHIIPTLILCMLFSFSVLGQIQTKNQVSPTAITAMKYRDTYLKITYSQPYKRGRNLFGGLIPFNKVWRTGANEATEITNTRMIMIEGRRIPPGTYSIFTIPNKESWKIIISRQQGLWGAFDYDQTQDLLRFQVPVQKLLPSKSFEAFNISFIEEGSAPKLRLAWGDTAVIINIKIP